MIDDSAGKSAYAVFAANTRMPNVANWMTQNRTFLPPKTYSAMSAMPVASSSPRNGLSFDASSEMPTNRIRGLHP